MVKEAQLSAIIAPLLEPHGLEIDHIAIIPAGRRSVVRVTVDGDGPLGRGPLLDDIAAATRDISDALDNDDSIPGSYTLEVSSRGTSSPLTEPKHYRRNRGRLLKVTLADSTTVVGRIVDSTDTSVDLEVTPESVKGNRNPKPVLHTFELAEIRKAIVQVELNRPVDESLDAIGDQDEDDADDDVDTELGDDEDEEEI